MDFRVPPGCTGLSFADGSRYPARDGRVVVDNDRHAAQIRHADPDGRIAPVRYVTTAPGRECRCGFMAYRWQSRCPRCHRLLND